MKQIISKQPILRAVAIGGAVLLGATCFALTPQGKAQNESKTSPLDVKIDETPINRDQPLMDSFATITQKVAPSVVKIFVTSSSPEQMLSGRDLDFFRFFFGNRGLGR